MRISCSASAGCSIHRRASSRSGDMTMIGCMDGAKQLPVEELWKDCTVNQLRKSATRSLARSYQQHCCQRTGPPQMALTTWPLWWPATLAGTKTIPFILKMSRHASWRGLRAMPVVVLAGGNRTRCSMGNAKKRLARRRHATENCSKERRSRTTQSSQLYATCWQLRSLTCRAAGLHFQKHAQRS